MKDQFNRTINYLRVSVTDRCNLRCFYCMPEEGITKKDHTEILRDEEILEAVHAAVKLGITKIRITGGEPLVRKGIYELIAKIRALKGVTEVVITTNGILLKDNIKKLKHAGISRVNLSLDTLSEKTYQKITKSRTMPDYYGIIESLIEHDMTPIKVNAVLLKGINDHEVAAFIELADRYDLRVRFIELMPIGHLPFDYDKHFISKDAILNRYKTLKPEIKDGVAHYYTSDNKRGKIGFINPISHKFCATCNRIRMTADGKIKPCLHTNEELSIKNLTQVQLQEQLTRAINNKPLSHRLSNKSAPIHRTMNKIGG